MHHRSYLAVFAVAGTLLGVSVGAFAQPAPASAPAATSAHAPGAYAQPHAHGRRHRPFGRALRGLGLSADQRGRVRDAMAAYRTSRSSAHPQTRAQLRANIESILSPAQRSQFEARVAAARAAQRGNAGSPAP